MQNPVAVVVVTLIGAIVLIIVSVQIGRIIERRIIERRKNEAAEEEEEPADSPMTPKTYNILKSVTVEHEGERNYASNNEFGLLLETQFKDGVLLITIKQKFGWEDSEWRCVIARLIDYSVVEYEWTRVTIPPPTLIPPAQEEEQVNPNPDTTTDA